MTRNVRLAEKLISFATVMLFFASGIAASVMISNWYLKCGAMAGFTVLLFLGCLRYYLANEMQISKWYRSTLSRWRRVLFDTVVFAAPVLSLVSAVVCVIFAVR